MAASSSTVTLSDIETFLASNPSADRVRQDYPFSRIAELKSHLDPALNHPAVRELHEIFNSDVDHKGSSELLRAIMEQIKLFQQTPEHQHFRSVFNALARLSSLSNSGNAPSNRAGRAKKASDVFTEFAGRSNIPGARDEHGNSTVGLTKDRAFTGLKITVLIYNWEMNNFSRARRIIESMGFSLYIFDASISLVGRAGPPLQHLSITDLDKSLSESSQCWIISGSHGNNPQTCQTMKASQRDIIIKHWREGMGLYVLGDNFPFITDANFLLASMYPGNNVSMNGNYIGKKNLSHSPDAQGGYIVEDYLTTGIVNCYSGVTVAELINTDKIPKFVKVMYESTDHLTLGYAPGLDGCGPVVISGAFTTLYHGLDTPGSIRLIQNTVGFLSTRMDESVSSSSDPVEESDGFDLTDCFKGEDCISFEEGPLAILLHPMLINPLQNCSDEALNNCLANAELNGSLLGRNPVIVRTAKMFWTCPFTRRPVAAYLPIVPIKNNYRLMTRILCEVFMGGLHFPFYAWMNFVSACQHMLNIQAGHSEIWQFFLNQALSFVKTNANFKDVGIPIPLGQAVDSFCFSLVNDHLCQENYSFTIAHAEIMFQLNRGENFDINLARHRIYLRNLYGYFRFAIMKDCSLLETLERSCYDFHLDLIPILNSGHISDYYPSDFPSPPATFTPAMLTFFYSTFFLNDNWKKIANMNFSDGLRFVMIHLNFSLWQPYTWVCDVIELLNQRFRHVFYRVHTQDYVPFVTTYGPTSLSCVGCGMSFVPDDLDISTASEKDLDVIRRIRNAHFREIYENESGQQANAPYHRIVRYVLRDQYPNELHSSPEIIRSCLLEMKKSWGNFYVPELLETLTNTIESYLCLRRLGAEESDDNTFMRKLLVEIGRS